ncbi:MAG TPA: hypothetical protein VKS01_08260, partial [Bryobacteraceae bacterium]|nr:hypothetical protein [Bryobacteraceae bacterium]
MPRIAWPNTDSISDNLESETGGVSTDSRWTIIVMISKKTLYLLTLAVASTLSAQTAPKSTAQKSTAA